MQASDIISCMQYTIRNIPPELDRALKARARRSGKSVNQVAIEALCESVGQSVPRRQLRNMPGAWSGEEAADFDRFLEQHRQVDPELWK
jgi:plasmid stability protein